MDAQTLIIVLSPLILISLILVVSGVISIIRKPLPWKDKWMWLPLLLVNIIGPIVYLVVGSRLLDEKAAILQGNQEDEQ